jgi:hypothetical protein
MKRLLPILCVLLLVPLARAGVRPLSLRDLCAGATRIVVGQVTHLRPEWEGNLIVTRVHLSVESDLKGGGDAVAVFKVPGGNVGKVGLRVSEAPRFQVGERVVVFLRPGVCPCDVYGWHQGKLTVVDGKIVELRNASLSALETAIAQNLAKKKEGR